MSLDPTELSLTDHDRRSATWIKIKAVLEARIDLYRRQNDNELTPERTAALRGKLAELKHLLAAGESQDQHQ